MDRVFKSREKQGDSEGVKEGHPELHDVAIDKQAIEYIKKAREEYDIATTDQMLLRGEENYYKSMSIIIDELASNPQIMDIYKNFLDDDDDDDDKQEANADEDTIKSVFHGFVLNHILELMDFNHLVAILNYIYGKSESDMDPFERLIKTYFEERKIENTAGGTNIVAILLHDKNQIAILVFNGGWQLAESEDIKDLKPTIDNMKISLERFNRIVGFIGDFKGNFNVFRVKQMAKKRNKGARCDQSSKSEAVNILNNIIDLEEKYMDIVETYTIDNTKKYNQTMICIFQELYLRFYDHVSRNNKRWFLYPTESIINNIEKISL